MTNMHETMYCPRDPEVETSLRCGRCGSLICPTCLVQSPVGSRCPSCAAIGRSPMQDTSRGQVVKAIIVGLVVAAIGGPALVGLLLLVDRFPRGSAFGALVGFVAIGYLAGEAVRRPTSDKDFSTAGLLFGAPCRHVRVRVTQSEERRLSQSGTSPVKRSGVWSGYKLDKRFQYIAGLSVFGAYLCRHVRGGGR